MTVNMANEDLQISCTILYEKSFFFYFLQLFLHGFGGGRRGVGAPKMIHIGIKSGHGGRRCRHWLERVVTRRGLEGEGSRIQLMAGGTSV